MENEKLEYARKEGFLKGMNILEEILLKLDSIENSFNIENAFEELRDFRNSESN